MAGRLINWANVQVWGLGKGIFWNKTEDDEVQLEEIDDDRFIVFLKCKYKQAKQLFWAGRISGFDLTFCIEKRFSGISSMRPGTQTIANRILEQTEDLLKDEKKRELEQYSTACPVKKIYNPWLRSDEGRRVQQECVQAERNESRAPFVGPEEGNRRSHRYNPNLDWIQFLATEEQQDLSFLVNEPMSQSQSTTSNKRPSNGSSSNAGSSTRNSPVDPLEDALTHLLSAIQKRRRSQ